MKEPKFKLLQIVYTRDGFVDYKQHLVKGVCCSSEKDYYSYYLDTNSYTCPEEAMFVSKNQIKEIVLEELKSRYEEQAERVKESYGE